MRRYFLILVLVAAAVVRFAYLASIWDTPLADIPIIDAEYYHEWAASLAEGRGGEEGIFFMAPLYPYVLSLFYRLIAPNPQVGLILQVLSGILLVYLIYRLGTCLFDPNVGLIAALMAALYRPFVYYEGVLLTAMLILLLNAAVLLLLLSPRRSRWIDLGAGALLGLSALARPSVLLFATMLMIFFILKSSEHGVRRSAFLLLGVVLMLAPVAYRHYRVGGQWVLTTAGAGMNFYAGNNPSAEGIYWEAPFIRSAEPQFENKDYRREASRRTGRELTITETSRYWLEQGLSFIRHQPFSYLKLLLRKVFLFFHRTEIPNNLSIYAALEFSGILRAVPFGFSLLAPIGMAFWFLQLRRSGLAIVHLYGLSYFLVTLLFFAASEYRLPILLVLLPLAAAGLTDLWDNLRKTRWKSALQYVITVVLFVIPINMPTSFTDNLASPRMDYFNLGSVLQKHGRDLDASRMLQRALIIDPDFTEAHRALGDAYHALNLHDQAAEEFRRAGLDPENELLILDAEELLYKAQIQARTGDLEGALESYREGAALHPHPPASAYYNMAYLDLHFGDTARALDELDLAADADPDESLVPYFRGLIFEEQGQWDLAKAKFIEALQRKINFHQARAHAALACLKMGDRDQAARFIEPLLGKRFKDPDLNDLINRIADQVGY